MSWVDRINAQGISIRDSRNAEEIRDAMLEEWSQEIPQADTSTASVIFRMFGMIARTIVDEREEAIRRAREG